MDRFTGSCELVRRVAKTLAWANLEIVIVAVGPDPPNADPRERQEAIADMYQAAQAAGLQIRSHSNMFDPGQILYQATFYQDETREKIRQDLPGIAARFDNICTF
jgi:hypothetical protein